MKLGNHHILGCINSLQITFLVLGAEPLIKKTTAFQMYCEKIELMAYALQCTLSNSILMYLKTV